MSKVQTPINIKLFNANFEQKSHDELYQQQVGRRFHSAVAKASAGKHYDKICTYCKNHGKSEAEFTSHFLRETKSEYSPYTCPEIMKIQCKNCLANDRYHIGHYKSQCPWKNTDSVTEKSAVSPPPGLQLPAKQGVAASCENANVGGKGQISSSNLSPTAISDSINANEGSSTPKVTNNKFCLFCKRQGFSEEVYSSHFLRESKDDKNSPYTCPEILQVQCSNCFNNGRYHFGHYLNQCPFKSESRVLVQSFTHHEFPAFDEEKILRQIMNSYKYKFDPNYKYYQLSAEEIKAYWAEKRAATKASRHSSPYYAASKQEESFTNQEASIESSESSEADSAKEIATGSNDISLDWLSANSSDCQSLSLDTSSFSLLQGSNTSSKFAFARHEEPAKGDLPSSTVASCLSDLEKLLRISSSPKMESHSDAHERFAESKVYLPADEGDDWSAINSRLQSNLEDFLMLYKQKTL